MNAHSNSSDPKDTLTATQQSFLQGLVDHLPSIAALLLPTSASYARVQDGVWSGGSFACWGYDNREATVRLTGSAANRHFEVRSLDGTANPYVALAGIIGAGMDGIYEQRKLVQTECKGIAGALDQRVRDDMGIVGSMPKSLQAARTELDANKTVKKFLGEEFLTKYLSVNKVRTYRAIVRFM